MAEIAFTIPLPALSINRWSGVSKRFISTEAKHWIQDVQYALSGPQNQNQLALIRDSFNAKKHSIGVALHFISPQNEFYNKQGLFSSRTCDITNVEKPLVDVLFLAKYSDSTYRSLEVDDKYISEMQSRKSAGTAYQIQVRIWLIARA